MPKNLHSAEKNNLLSGKWMRSRSLPQENAVWMEELILIQQDNKISGEKIFSVQGTIPDSNDVLKEEKGKTPLYGLEKNGHWYLYTKDLTADKKSEPDEFKIVVENDFLILEFERKDGSFYTERYKKSAV